MEAIDYTQIAASAPPEQEENFSPSSLFLAADNHNLGNENQSWYDPTTWADKTVGAGKFIASSLLSGANSFYNTGVAVNNWLGGDAAVNDTTTWISSLDDDLGKYYAQNKEAADLAGFIATSFIPGIGSVKILNAGQKALNAAREGWVGTNLAKATGLLVPDVAKYTRLAAADLAQSSATFSAINTNTLKALGAGFGQAAIESAVFETAVAATMFKSPVLEGQDLTDLLHNIAVGTVLGGGIGGVLTGAGTFAAIKKTVKEADLLEKPWTHITEFPGVSPAERIIGRFDDLDSMRKAEIPAGEFAGKINRLAGDKESKLMNLAREDVHKMTAGGDSELANIVADSLVGVDSKTVMQNLLHAQDISRLGTPSKIDRAIKKALDALSPEEAQNLKLGYVKVSGEGAGGISFEAPRILGIADNAKNETEVLRTVKDYGFKEADVWDGYKVKNHTEAEARYIWADKFAKLKDGMSIHENDIPLLERALQDKFTNFAMVTESGSKVKLSSTQELFETLQATKEKLANQFVLGKRFTTEETAKITNTRLAFVEGERSSDLGADYLARQAYQKSYTESLISKGLWSAEKGLIDTSTKPTYFKVGYDTSELGRMNPNLVDAMSFIKTKQKVYQQSIDAVTANYTEELANRFYHPDEKLLLQANRFGAGPGLFSFANGAYHSLESWAESTGAATNALIKKRVSAVTEALNPAIYKLANKQEAAIEFEAINNKIAGTTEKYVLNEAGDALISRQLAEYRKAIAAGKEGKIPKLQQGAPEEIPITHPETLEAITAHIENRGARTTAFQELRAAQGLEDAKDATTFYPIRPNPRDYPHFAFVVDPTVTGVGHVSMIHAATERELGDLISKVPDSYKTITKGQSEEYHRAINDFEYERTLHENYIDSDLKSKGINTAFFPKTDPQKIAQDLLQDHVRGEMTFSRELVNAKFEKEFSELRRLGEQYTNVSASKYGGTVKVAENATKNPYLNYVKTSLDISQMSEHPLLQGFNTLADKTFSRAMDSVVGLWKNSVKSPADLELINKELQKNGVKSAYYDSALSALANHTASQGALKTFVGNANSLISTLVLRLDPMNALNNAIGANVLLGAETKNLIRAIESGNSGVAGELASLAKVKVPGTEDTILSAPKLIAASMKRYFSDEGIELAKTYKQNGWITDITAQTKSILDDLTLKGAERDSELAARINSAFLKAKAFGDLGEKVTGNKLAEEFNRFVAADVMKQISDLGVKAGVIGPQEQISYINTFVNRTQGNMLASQRPLMFQGAVGQAIGLFQTYQFNMIQQMLRYVGEGSKKDVATLLGLQGTIYGMNGLPGFNFINQHIVGTASGNPHHRDLFDATYGVAGKEAGNWLLYGMPSNMLHANLYSRGDINPRQATVIPVNPVDIPMINASASFFGNLKDTAGKITSGGNVWETLLQGVEHNGLSRPLAGLAQTLQATTGNGQVIATSKKGNIMGANDLIHLSTLARLAGGKPFDEALTNDATYRIAAYQAADHLKAEHLNETIKSTLIAGQEPDASQMEKFAGDYVALGGKQKQFNKHVMDLHKQANTLQSNKIAESLTSPYAQSMQTIMGGNAMQDGRVSAK